MTRVVSRLLSIHGWKATVVNMPQAAIELVREWPQRFQVVITDMSMPGMSGDELAHALKQLAPHLPVILSTGGAEGTATLFAGTLPKPFEIQLLLDMVERCVGRALVGL